MEDKLNYDNMDTNKQFNPRYEKIIKSGILFSAIIFVITSTLIGFTAYKSLSQTDIYQGVYIEDIYVGGENKDDAITEVEKKYISTLDNKAFNITANTVSKRITYKEIDARYNYEKAIVQAYNVGREGNVIQRLILISKAKRNKVIIPLQIDINDKKLKKKINTLANEIYIPVNEHQKEIKESQLLLYIGTSGESLNIEKSSKKVWQELQKKDVKNIVLNVEEIKPKPLDADRIYKEICTKPVDASYEIKDFRIHIKPHVTGIDFDKENARELIKNKQGRQEIAIPLILTEPAILTEVIEAELFKDKLSSYKTNFNAGYVERSHNIALAASKINDIVLAPNDEFYFNEIVGERTLEAGFQNAHVYFGDEIIDGVGGGICQVSTTLYNAVLYSDLQVLRRSNHSMTVGYVPVGQDAAVAYDVLDFGFANNTSNPIIIKSIVGTGNITFELYGVEENKGKTIEIYNDTRQIIPYPVEYIDDPEMEIGEEKVKQKGGDGYTVDTYKIIKKDGKIISRQMITKSRYKPIKKKVLVGTKEQEQETFFEKLDEIFEQPLENQEKDRDEIPEEEKNNEDIIEELNEEKPELL